MIKKKKPPCEFHHVESAEGVYGFLADAKDVDPRSMREIARVAGVNQFTAHTVLSGRAKTCAALDNVLDLANALGYELGFRPAVAP